MRDVQTPSGYCLVLNAMQLHMTLTLGALHKVFLRFSAVMFHNSFQWLFILATMSSQEKRGMGEGLSVLLQEVSN